MTATLRTMARLLRGWWLQFGWLAPVLMVLTIATSLLEGLAISLLLQIGRAHV